MAAGEIQRLRPQWMVTWGCYSRRFWAYPLFAVHRRAILCAYYPDALIARMDEAERGVAHLAGQQRGGE